MFNKLTQWFFYNLGWLGVAMCMISCTGDRLIITDPLEETALSTQPPTRQIMTDYTLQYMTSPTPTGCMSTTRPYHTITTEIDYTHRQIAVRQRIDYTNLTEDVLEKILLHIEPNRWSAGFQMNSTEIDGNLVEYTLDERELQLALLTPLKSQCSVEIHLDYTFNVPFIGEGVSPSKGYFGATHRQVNLGHWLGTIAPYRQGEWQSRASTFIGEYELVEQADWDVTINLIDPPDNLQLAVPGVLSGNDNTHYRYRLNSARDFSMSLSDEYTITTQETAFKSVVELYTFNSLVENGAREQALKIAAQSINTFSALFGEYPRDRMVVIQGDFPDGMELSGLVFVGNNWFARFPGGQQNYLTLITTHEVAHQWWYAAVGNDPARSPWLDEALATYSEYLFLEQNYPDLLDWWWGFRVSAFTPTGMVDSSIYIFETPRQYINAVYLRGVRMLHDLRGDIGDEAFFALLRNYYTQSQGKIATPEMFWALMSTQQYAQTRQTRTEYFSQPEILRGNE